MDDSIPYFSLENNELTFDEVNQSIYQKVIEIISNEYDTRLIREMCEVAYTALKPYREQISQRGCSTMKSAIGEYEARRKTPSKTIMTRFLGLIPSHRALFQCYFSSFPEGAQQTWKHLTRHSCISSSDAEELYHYSIGNISTHEWDKPNLPEPEMAWFSLWQSTRIFQRNAPTTHEIFASTDGRIFNQFFLPMLLLPEAYTPFSSATLPDEKLLVHAYEPSLLDEILLMYTLKKQGYLTIGNKHKLAAHRLQAALEKITLREFFPADSTVPHLRAQLTLTVMSAFFQNTQGEMPAIAKELKTIWKTKLTQSPLILIPLLLPHITGTKANDISQSYRPEYLEEVTEILLQTLSTGHWCAIDHFLLYYRTKAWDLSPFREYQIDQMKLKNKKSGCELSPINMYTELVNPFLKGYLFLLAGFGILEIAYEDYEPEHHVTPYSTLRYLRLTELGRFVLGLTDTFEPPKVEKDEASLFQLSPNHLIIRSLVPDNPYKAVVEDMALSMGSGYYQFSSESMLNNCQRHGDVLERIEQFKHFIGKELPDNWEQFFCSLQQRLHSISKVSAGQYNIYQLNAENEELLQLFASDPELKALTLQAEGWLLLIKEENEKAVADRLQAVGYLL